MSLVSVVIPTHNRAGFLGLAIESVLRQKFHDCELIVVDDGSTDQTRDVLANYGGRLRYLFQENSGVGSARNLGIRAAGGQWIAFLDSDDEWREDYLLTQAAQIRRFPEAVAHQTNATSVALDGERRNYYEQVKFSDQFRGESCRMLRRPLRQIVRYGLTFLQASVIRRDVLLSLGAFDESLRIGEDLDVLGRVALQGPFAFCRTELVEVFRREEAIANLMAQSLGNSIDRFGSFSRVYRRLLGQADLAAAERAAVRRALGASLRGLGNAWVRAGNPAEGRSHYRESFAAFPSTTAFLKFAATFFPRRVSELLVRRG